MLVWWQFLHKYLWHCAHKRCYKASLDWRLSNRWPLETEFRRQVALSLQCSFTAKCFMNTTKSGLILPSSELDFQRQTLMPSSSLLSYFSVQKRSLWTGSLVAARENAKMNKNALSTFCHNGCQRSTSRLFFCETPNVALCATLKRIIHVYLLPGVCILHWKYSPLSCFAVHI